MYHKCDPSDDDCGTHLSHEAGKDFGLVQPPNDDPSKQIDSMSSSQRVGGSSARPVCLARNVYVLERKKRRNRSFRQQDGRLVPKNTTVSVPLSLFILRRAWRHYIVPSSQRLEEPQTCKMRFYLRDTTQSQITLDVTNQHSSDVFFSALHWFDVVLLPWMLAFLPLPPFQLLCQLAQFVYDFKRFYVVSGTLVLYVTNCLVDQRHYVLPAVIMLFFNIRAS